MKECPFIQVCVLFRKTLAGLRDVAMLMKARHCLRDHQSCALHHIVVEFGPAGVPEGLFPNQTGRAELIIRGSERKEGPESGFATKDQG